MRLRIITALVFSLAVSTGSLKGVEEEAAPLKSGPQVGDAARPYHPLLCTGDYLGQRWCMVCTYRGEGKAMAIVFTREGGDLVRELISAVEASTKKHKKVGGIVTFLTTTGKKAGQAEALTGAKVVFINDGEKSQYESLRKLAKTQKIVNSSLNIYTDDGPSSYGLSPEAAVTVLVADRSATVKMNIALRKTDLTRARVKDVAEKIDKALGAL